MKTIHDYVLDVKAKRKYRWHPLNASFSVLFIISLLAALFFGFGKEKLYFGYSMAVAIPSCFCLIWIQRYIMPVCSSCQSKMSYKKFNIPASERRWFDELGNTRGSTDEILYRHDKNHMKRVFRVAYVCNECMSYVPGAPRSTEHVLGGEASHRRTKKRYVRRVAKEDRKPLKIRKRAK